MSKLSKVQEKALRKVRDNQPVNGSAVWALIRAGLAEYEVTRGLVLTESGQEAARHLEPEPETTQEGAMF